MSEHSVPLLDGLTIGDSCHRLAVLRPLTAGDVIDAVTASERLLETSNGPELVSSPGLIGVHTLRLQIVRIGDHPGPLSMAELRKLSAVDLAMLQHEAERIDAASRAVTQRGRDETPAGQGAADAGANGSQASGAVS